MLLRLVVLTLLSLCVASCAAQKVWEKPGASPNEFSQDRYACAQQSQQPYSGAYVNRYGGSANSGMTTNGMLYDACMNARGWTLTAKTESGSTPYGDAVKALEAEGQEMCTRADLQMHFRKSPCQPKDASLEQLADRSKVSSEEKVALNEWRSVAGQLNRKLASVHRQYNPQKGNAMAQVIEKNNAAGDRIALDFYEGRITRGDFNKRRLDIYTQWNDEMTLAMRNN